MPLGIRPTVDFAFKKIFGSPQNSVALIGLLHAILKLARPIASVEILNPFSYQEFADSKLIVLDVRCQDADGRWLNVEMQVSSFAGLIERLVYYACSMYVDQLSKGGNYALVGAREECREECRKSAVVETVRMLEELVGEPLSPIENLVTQTISSLEMRVTQLKRQLRERQA